MNQASTQDFIGSWELISWTISIPDGDRVTEPFGKSPTGLIVYSESGWMTAAICTQDRTLMPTTQSPRLLPAEMLAEAYKSYFHYAGTFRVEGETVIHSVTMSLNPNFVGTEQVRKFRFSDKRLILTGEDTVNSQTRLHQLVWQRL